MKQSDRYLKIVEWSEEDQCYVGTCPGLMLGGVHGPVESEVYKELCRTVDEWLKIYKDDGDPLPAPTVRSNYSGKFVVRVGKEMHKELAIRAAREGQSLNSYCIRLMKEQSSPYGVNERVRCSRRKSVPCEAR
jgi:predicted HicB family RNase H-like nuclease